MSTYADPQTAIEAGRQALRPLNRYPWYDPVNDGLRRVEVRPPQEVSSVEVSPALNFLLLWGALAMLAVVLAALMFMILRAVRLRRASNGNRGEALVIGEAQRIEELPFPVARGKVSLLEQARSFYQAGNHAAAMLYLFSHQLVQLDRRQIIRLAKGKTNRQYLREVGRSEMLRQLVGQTLVAFEDVFFGQHDIDRRRFEACWSRLPEFESLLAQGPSSA
jgi:hypothetical protein